MSNNRRNFSGNSKILQEPLVVNPHQRTTTFTRVDNEASQITQQDTRSIKVSNRPQNSQSPRTSAFIFNDVSTSPKKGHPSSVAPKAVEETYTSDQLVFDDKETRQQNTRIPKFFKKGNNHSYDETPPSSSSTSINSKNTSTNYKNIANTSKISIVQSFGNGKNKNVKKQMYHHKNVSDDNIELMPTLAMGYENSLDKRLQKTNRELRITGNGYYFDKNVVSDEDDYEDEEEYDETPQIHESYLYSDDDNYQDEHWNDENTYNDNFEHQQEENQIYNPEATVPRQSNQRPHLLSKLSSSSSLYQQQDQARSKSPPKSPNSKHQSRPHNIRPKSSDLSLYTQSQAPYPIQGPSVQQSQYVENEIPASEKPKNKKKKNFFKKVLNFDKRSKSPNKTNGQSHGNTSKHDNVLAFIPQQDSMNEEIDYSAISRINQTRPRSHSIESKASMRSFDEDIIPGPTGTSNIDISESSIFDLVNNFPIISSLFRIIDESESLTLQGKLIIKVGLLLIIFYQVQSFLEAIGIISTSNDI